MDLLTIAKLIYGRCQELERLRETLGALANTKDETAANYERTLATVIMSLRHNKPFKLGDMVITDCPVSIIEKVARGICYHEKREMDKAESAYKNAFKIISLTESQLNGYQSINRYLSEISPGKS